MWMAVLDWFLSILYFILGFFGSEDNIWYICLGVIWFIIGCMICYSHKNYKKTRREREAHCEERYEQICKELYEIREKQRLS